MPLLVTVELVASVDKLVEPVTEVIELVALTEARVVCWTVLDELVEADEEGLELVAEALLDTLLPGEIW